MVVVGSKCDEVNGIRNPETTKTVRSIADPAMKQTAPSSNQCLHTEVRTGRNRAYYRTSGRVGFDDQMHRR